MLAIGLTGGIGSGKSTVAALLVERGAHLIDADELARRAVAPGSEGLKLVVERFGSEVLLPDGSLDRPRLAKIVFADDRARADLDAIVHPLVGTAMTTRLLDHAATDHVVVLDIPLLAEGGKDRYPLAGVIVVDCPIDTAIDRLVSLRQMERPDAEARIAAQASRAERLAMADFVIMNMGSLEELQQMVARAWAWIGQLRGESATPK